MPNSLRANRNPPFAQPHLTRLSTKQQIATDDLAPELKRHAPGEALKPQTLYLKCRVSNTRRRASRLESSVLAPRLERTPASLGPGSSGTVAGSWSLVSGLGTASGAKGEFNRFLRQFAPLCAMLEEHRKITQAKLALADAHGGPSKHKRGRMKIDEIRIGYCYDRRNHSSERALRAACHEDTSRSRRH